MACTTINILFCLLSLAPCLTHPHNNPSYCLAPLPLFFSLSVSSSPAKPGPPLKPKPSRERIAIALSQMEKRTSQASVVAAPEPTSPSYVSYPQHFQRYSMRMLSCRCSSQANACCTADHLIRPLASSRSTPRPAERSRDPPPVSARSSRCESMPPSSTSTGPPIKRYTQCSA